MTGFVGGRLSDAMLEEQIDRMWSEPWYERESLRAGDYGITVLHHGEIDRQGTTVWQGERRFGVLFGAVTNHQRLDIDTESLFATLLDEPSELLTQIDGPFVVAAVDAAADKVVLGTDKLGTRRLFYAPTDPFVFGTDVAPLLERIDEPSVDERGLCDLLAIGGVWGDRTLVDEVQSLPSGTVLTDRDGGRSTRRYWDFTFEETDEPDYVETLVDSYRRAVSDTAATLDDAGVWLSGGLDSRALAAVLAQSHPSLVTYTYDANPVGGINLDVAREVADLLGLRNERVAIGPDQFLDVFEDAISLTDGLTPWTGLTNLSAVFTLPDDAGVVLEASGQAVLMGSGIWRADFERSETAAEALYQGEHLLGREQTTRLLDLDVDPMRTYREVVDDGPQDRFRAKALSGLYQQYFRAGDFTTNKLARYRVGTRVPFAHGEFLRTVMELPYELRERTVPFTDGKVPFGCAPMKLELVRSLNRGLDDIKYERTRVAPKRPLWMHALGFVASTGLRRLRSDIASGGKTMAGEWYREHDGVRRKIDGLLDDARERECFAADELDRIQREHLDGEAEHIKPIACITTAEWWFQHNVDT